MKVTGGDREVGLELFNEVFTTPACPHFFPQMKVLGVCPGRNSGREALQEWNGPQQSDSREPLSEVSTHHRSKTHTTLITSAPPPLRRICTVPL